MYKFNFMRVAAWSVQNILQVAITIYAVLNVGTWAENVLIFWANLMMVASCLTAIAVSSIKDNDDHTSIKHFEKGPSVPVSVNTITDIITALICASAGWYWLATCFVIIAVAYVGTWSKWEEYKTRRGY